jgi:hypothetical protein
MATIVYAAFFVVVLAMPIYGGKAYDANGYKPFAAPVPLIAKNGTSTSPLSPFRWRCWRPALRR